jgi:ribosome-binding protein aMBF1 (putative translation factor)
VRVSSNHDGATPSHKIVQYEPAKPRGWAAPSAETVTTIRAAVARNVDRERRGAGFTQAVLANACQISENTVGRLENAQVGEPRLLTLVAVSFALDVSLLKLLRGLPGLPTDD